MAFVLVNQSPGCRVSLGEGALVLIAGNVGLAGSSPAHAAGPQGVGAGQLSLPCAAMTSSPIPLCCQGQKWVCLEEAV